MRTTALVRRIIQQIFRDKRTLALLFIAPLFILTLMYLVFNGETVEPTIGVENVNQQTVDQLEKSNIHVKSFENITDTKETIIEQDLDGFLKVEKDQTTLILLNSDPSLGKNLQMKINQIIQTKLPPPFPEEKELKMNTQTNDIYKTEYIYGSSDTKYFDVFSPILIGFFVFFFVFLISGIGLLKERTTGTLERLMVTPIRRGEIVTAYLVGFGIFAVLQTVIIVLFSIHVLDIILVGSIWNVILINLILALVDLSLGILLSSFAASEFQMVQFIPIAVVPQIFFSGIFPLESMPDWLQVLAKVMPLYYAGDALTGVMYKGWGLEDISGDLYILIIFATIFIILNLFALKKYRKI
ncbi:ABC-2 type transport system permease protein [Oikeobacillus pervagus]|uniref:ABC-2 type transport system permease protein n=1 Tax=Oikeobacillus pervagus TaxID=1325931 RepID=A0AAJ1WHW3_9BACI|nr:ABC transporter permease [Oikeobacillus pervagus]MDQ0216647.1 ABC-2 type transport system permease protein [Oikeobacillus pervagus]